MKPSIPKGTRDFSPEEMVKRNYIFDTIKKVFQLYGYLPIETPAMENLETLMGKYGEEGDRLIFKILNSGDYLEKADLHYAQTETSDYKRFTSQISEKALRYDLTVPFARYVVQHQNEITFPFKRYQIQPVWRADRPQKGRYREFYQCDADVIGSNSLINEVELIQIIDDVFTRLNLPVVIKVNNRKVLFGIANYFGIYTNKTIDFIIALDKIDKIGPDAVAEEIIKNNMVDSSMAQENIASGSLLFFKEYINKDILSFKNLFSHQSRDYPTSLKGIEEIKYIQETVPKINVLKKSRLYFDPYLARGLNYYTGAIFEIVIDTERSKSEFKSSICGGGRYDDLTGIFGLPNVSGVGISFGADRIYDVLEEMKLFPESVFASTKLLFATFGEAEQNYCLPLLAEVRKAGINSEIYPDANAKMKKQMSYADGKMIPFVAIVGSDEMKSGMLSFKNMASGEQTKIKIEEIIEQLK